MANESSFYGTAISTRGTPLVGQSVAICTQPANTSTTPCSPLVNTFTDITGATPTGTPGITTTDSFGNFHFYLPSGIYTVQIYGPQVASPVVQKDFFVPIGSSSDNTFTGNTITTNLNKTVTAAGYMKCDNSTDDTAGLTSAITAAGLGGTVIIPPGTCLVNIESSTFNLYDGMMIVGAGKFATILKRKNGGAANNPFFSVAPGGGFGSTGNVTLMSFTIDGNQVNQTGGADTVNGGATSKFQSVNMRYINSWNNGIGFFPGGTSNTADALIAFSDFESNGTRAGCSGVAVCNDLRLGQPLRVRVIANRSDSSQNFINTSSNTGVGAFTISENIVNNCLGFAVALGGGTAGAGGGEITRNNFNCPTSTQNIIDMAFWSDVIVSDNNITCGTSTTFGISDLPPAQRVIIKGNRIIGNPAANLNGGCIGFGGSDSVISDNICDNPSGFGIEIDVPASPVTNSTALTIEGNVIKNCSRASTGALAGITLSIAGGGGTLSNVIIKGNRIYDAQGSKTCGWGIGVGLSGQTSGFTGITMEGNDVRGNLNGGIKATGLTGQTGWQVLNNPGDTNVGLCFSSASPAVCGVASSGAVAIANPATTIQVNTTAVTANSQILVFEDSSLGAALGVTCNATAGRTYMVTARTAGTSFTITASATPATNSACLNWSIAQPAL